MSSINHVAGRASRAGEAKHTVMIVDDHPLVCKGLAELIREEPDLEVTAVVGTAADAMAALGRLPQVPEPLTWVSGLAMGRKYDRLDLLREWTVQYRAQYAEAARLAREEAEARP